MGTFWEPETRDVIGRLRSAAPTHDERPSRDWQVQLRLRELGKMLLGAMLLGAVFLVGMLGMAGKLEIVLPARAAYVQLVTDLAPDRDRYAKARLSRPTSRARAGRRTRSFE